ncbi:phage head closure protein [Sinorhizobium medicae]|uniref:Phage head closure protein n=1 Tax=Sinorhizobium medicae TaxID=110321 RepID=A0A6G1WQX4_9HYPH|nr:MULTISPECIES: phage head closure protein [Sinorhizobium]MBO1943621.1 phage head closure protein [Sinorhizobium medicae]MDX0462136.1 phage head closure protein [Sinorhizobium medicae]MDX0536101.1 phage head closure protein [Sinorhizobium medicae]MDX0555141.1 phage head closure protein [Sinorhizobium medicae]MDX0560974.1 phage head closure protein [Sinorhizobium medicae]
MTIAAGDLREKITIERASYINNEFNEPVETWAPYISRRARREDSGSGEKEAAGQVGAFLMARFAIRRDALVDGIKPTDRIAYDGAHWNIKEMKQLRDNTRFLEITAVKDLG